MSSACGAASSEPYPLDEEGKAPSMRTIESEMDDGYAATDESAFPSSAQDRERHLRLHQRAVGTVPPVGSSDGREHSEIITSNPAARGSMIQFPVVDPRGYFDRDAYLRAHVQGLLEDERRFERATRVCRWCHITWNGLGGASTATSLVISAIGASEYIDPRLANILTVVLGVSTGVCIWAGNQTKRVSHEYHEEQVKIQDSLGVPARWRNHEVRIQIDQFTGRGEQAATTGAR